MSGRIAKLREEKEKQKEAVKTIDAVRMSLYHGSSSSILTDDFAKMREETLAKVEDAYAVLKQGPNLADLALCLTVKGHILSERNNIGEAVAACRTAIELFAAANQKGSLSRRRYADWVGSLIRHGFYLSCLGQSQEAERAYLEALERPNLIVAQTMLCSQGFAS